MIALMFGMSGTAWTIIIIVLLLLLCGYVVITDDLDWFD